MSGHCRDCKHWGKERWVYATGFASGEEPMTWRECELTESNPDSSDTLPKPTKAFVIDDEYSQSLVTAPNFGCVQYEANDGDVLG